MKKIGVITINVDTNYGNRLQNYAAVKILQEYGEAKNIRKYERCEEKSSISIKLRRFLRIFKLLLKKILKKDYEYDKYINFLKFNKNISHCREMICKNTNFDKLNENFDYFATGSDQVWNPKLYPNMYVNMLGFTDNNKKIAFAPSISMDSLSIEQEQIFKELLKDFDNLSCREEQGAKLIRDITNKEVSVIVDPTLMLSSNEWDKLAVMPKKHNPNMKYVLLYFLGDMNKEYEKIVLNIQEKYNLEVINILDKKSKYYSCGPSEFIYLIKNSSIILTDSFHGSVFSYIYDKPFRIFYRQGDCGYMNSRLTNLMQKLHLNEDVYITENTNLDNILETNYDKNYLKIEQQKFKKYLDEILK